MEVRPLPLVLAAVALALAGCELPPGNPAVQQKPTEKPRPAEPVEIVRDAAAGAPAGAAADDKLLEVERWAREIQRRDDLRSRIERGAPPPPAPASSDDKYNPQTDIVGESEQRPTAADPLRSAAASQPRPAAEPSGAATHEASAAAPPPAPALAGVSLSAGHSPPRSAFPLPRPAANAPEAATYYPLTLREFVEQWLVDDADRSFRSQLDRRILQLLAGNLDAAQAPLEIAGPEQSAIVAAMLNLLSAAREAQGGDPRAEAARILSQLDELRDQLVRTADLRITALHICRAVRGFGQYELIEPATFVAGRENEFVAYCEIADFQSEKQDDASYLARFSMRSAVLNSAGDVLLDITDDPVEDRCRARRRDCFIPRLLRLPASLSAGTYVLKVTIIDRIGGKVAEQRAPFRLIVRS